MPKPFESEAVTIDNHQQQSEFTRYRQGFPIHNIYIYIYIYIYMYLYIYIYMYLYIYIYIYIYLYICMKSSRHEGIRFSWKYVERVPRVPEAVLLFGSNSKSHPQVLD